MGQRNKHWLCKFHFIFAFCAFGVSNMLTDILALWWCSFWICGLSTVSDHMCTRGNNLFRNSQFILAF